MRTVLVRRAIACALAASVGCGGGAGERGGAEEAARPASAGSETAAGTEPTATETQAPTQEPADESARRVPAHGPLSEPDLHRGVMARLRDPRLPSCTIGALPPAMRRRVTPGADETLAGAVSFPLPEGTVSAGRAGDRELAVYLSSRLDPASEIGDLGYRVRVREGGGERDLALGLSALRPLVLVHNTMIPLVEDGALQLEAQLRALDDASIDFVPVDGTTTVRSEREFLLRCDLDDLARDQDSDGVTDLEEERLLTDVWDADTDGDGTRDGDDRSPLGATTPSEPADQLWLAAYRQLVRAEARDGLLLVVRSGARIDVGGEGEGRVLVLREDELGAYQRRFGLHAPLVIAVTMRGADRARVEIDDAWSESSHDARRDASGAWTFTARR